MQSRPPKVAKTALNVGAEKRGATMLTTTFATTTTQTFRSPVGRSSRLGKRMIVFDDDDDEP